MSDKPGFWSSTFTEDEAITASHDYSQINCDEDGSVYVVEYLPEKQGRSLICRYSGADREELTPDGFSVQSKVHGYGGRSWCLVANALVFVNADDQQLYIQSFNQSKSIRQLTHTDSSRFLEPIWDKKRNRLIVVEEIHSGEEVENRLASVCLKSGFIEVLHEGNDFYTYPTLSPSGDELAFIAWCHPYQPWISTQLHTASIDAYGALSQVRVKAGLEECEALSQPQYNHLGELSFISDKHGYWTICVNALEQCQAKLNAESDQMSSPWQSGYYQYGFYGDQLAQISIVHDGVKLFLNDQEITPKPVSYIKELTIHGSHLYLLAAGPMASIGLVHIDLAKPDEYRVISGFECPVASEEVSVPIALDFAGIEQEQISYGYFYVATNSQYSNIGKSPLIVFLHGGPTAATYPVFSAKVQYWTQRGFAVLDLNYRGSSNYGRAYRLSLQHKWGISELEDIRAALDTLIQQNLVDESALFIRGSSAGGYTVLNALCDLSCFAAGASLYGVTDPAKLNEVTHKFESNYLGWLIGDPDKHIDRYAAYAPINKAEKMRTPVIFFQGEKDAVVVPEQARSFVECLSEQGTEVQAHYFPNEGHGFKDPDNQRFALKKELAFYQQQLLKNK